MKVRRTLAVAALVLLSLPWLSAPAQAGVVVGIGVPGPFFRPYPPPRYYSYGPRLYVGPPAVVVAPAPVVVAPTPAVYVQPSAAVVPPPPPPAPLPAPTPPPGR